MTWKAGAAASWTTAFAGADLNALAANSTVLSSLAAIDNGTNADQFIDFSVRVTIASSTIANGASFALWPYYQLDDGVTYGDGQFPSGTQTAKTPGPLPPITIQLWPGASQTTLTGFFVGAPLAPGLFKPLFQNLCGFALAAVTTHVIKYRTYNA